MQNNCINERIKELRKLLLKHQLDAYIIPSADPHQGEYTPLIWKRREWISGFTGSAGNVLVTAFMAGLWTDSRYFIQAEEELKNSEIKLFKEGLPDVPSLAEFLSKELKERARIGIDPLLFSISQVQEFKNTFADKQLTTIPITDNLVDQIRQLKIEESQPEKIFIHPVEYAGEEVKDKLKRLRAAMQEKECDLHVITALDSIAWLFNLRGADVEYNPLFIAYAVVKLDKAYIFTDLRKVTTEIKKQLADFVEFLEYSEFSHKLSEYAKEHKKVWLDNNAVNCWIEDFFKNIKIYYAVSPIIFFKSIKNPTEMAGMRKSHVRDGAAVVKFLYWLDQNLGKIKITEISAQNKLEEIRRQNENFRGLSFGTISSYGAHAAINHYSASSESDCEIKADGIYLLDSGGQYAEGTTDITRTIAIGKPSVEQIDRYTRVLKGNLQLTRAVFPEGTRGCQLDSFSRQFLWKNGLNFGHNTGHGVGAYLCVHEGPQSLSPTRNVHIQFKEGMCTSNEPGFYKDGEYGIRIENILLTIKKTMPNGVSFLAFENLSICPYDLKLIDKKLLTIDEINYINAYHVEVYTKLASFLNKEEQNWLKNATKKI